MGVHSRADGDFAPLGAFMGKCGIFQSLPYFIRWLTEMRTQLTNMHRFRQLA
jgi:hypothetical protein